MSYSKTMRRPLILFIGAETQRHTRVTREANAIEERLARFKRFEFQARHDCSFDDLIDHLLALKPAMLHIACHGDGEGLHFKDGVVAHDDVLEELKAHRSLSSVVFSVCYSASLAEGLAAHVTDTVGMRDAISDDGAIAFSTVLYGAYASGRSLRESVEAGVRKLGRTNGLKAEAAFPVVFPELIDVPRTPRVSLPPVEAADVPLQARLRGLLSAASGPDFDALLEGRGPDAARLLELKAKDFLGLLVAVVKQDASLRAAACQLAAHLLPHAVDWAGFDDQFRSASSSTKVPHLTLPFLAGPLCELVAARVSRRPARLDEEHPATQLRLPAAAKVGLLDLSAVAETLAENVVKKAGLPVPTEQAERLAALNEVLSFKRDYGGRDGERMQMHVVFASATEGAIEAIREQVDALFLIQGRATAEQAFVLFFLQQLFEWENSNDSGPA